MTNLYPQDEEYSAFVGKYEDERFEFDLTEAGVVVTEDHEIGSYYFANSLANAIDYHRKQVALTHIRRVFLSGKYQGGKDDDRECILCQPLGATLLYEAITNAEKAGCDYKTEIKPITPIGKFEAYYRANPPDDPDRFVYLIEHDGLWKIGRTSDPVRRLMEYMNQWQDKSIEFEHVIETNDDVRLERDYHEHFHQVRVQGEWFRLSDTNVRSFKRNKRVMY